MGVIMPEGLLDFIKTPEGIGLLSTAFGGFAGARRGQPLNSLGRAGLAGITGYNTALDLRSNLANNEMHRALYGAQIGNYNSEVEQRKAALEKERQKQEALRAFLTPKPDIPKPQPDGDAYVPNQMGFTDGTLPIPDGNGVTVTDLPPDRGLDSSQSINKYPVLSYQPQILNNRTNEVKQPTAINQQIDYNVLLRAGYSPEEVQKIAGIQNIGLPEVARVEETTDDQGRPVRVQLDKYGRVVGSSMSQWKAPIQIDQGDKQALVDPTTLAVRGIMPKSQTPDSAAMNYNRAFYPSGEPNIPYQQYETNKAEKGATKVDVNTGQKGLENEMKFSSAFKAEPIYKAHQDVQSAYKQIAAGLNLKSPAGDLAAATKLMKMLDPGSVVRESELAMAMQASGKLDRLMNYGNMVVTGQKLTPTQRLDFQKLADELLNESAKQYNAKREEYKTFADSYKLNSDVLLGKPVQVNQPAQPSTGQTPNAKPLPKPMKGMTRNGYKFKGGDPADQNNWEKQ